MLTDVGDEDMEEVMEGVEMEVLVMLLLRSGEEDEDEGDGKNRFGV